MNKLLFTFLFFVTISSYADNKYKKVTFQVKGKEANNFLACVENECHHNSSTAYVDGSQPVRFYIYNRSIPNKVAYKEILWDSSCRSLLSLCHKKTNNSYSDTLCRTLPAYVPSSGFYIIAYSEVKDSNLCIYGCRAQY